MNWIASCCTAPICPLTGLATKPLIQTLYRPKIKTAKRQFKLWYTETFLARLSKFRTSCSFDNFYFVIIKYPECPISSHHPLAREWDTHPPTPVHIRTQIRTRTLFHHLYTHVGHLSNNFNINQEGHIERKQSFSRLRYHLYYPKSGSVKRSFFFWSLRSSPSMLIS